MFQWKIPKCLKPVIIKIWEQMGIIKKIDRFTLEFQKTKFNIENMGEIYEQLNLF
jgi:hypothetical protein